MSEQKTIAYNCNAAIFSISETWLDSSVYDGEIDSQNYTVLRNDRNRNGGGVCMYIRNDISFYVRYDLSNNTNECIFVEILLPRNKPIIVGT
jgi:hypothetical protein